MITRLNVDTAFTASTVDREGEFHTCFVLPSLKFLRKLLSEEDIHQ